MLLKSILVQTVARSHAARVHSRFVYLPAKRYTMVWVSSPYRQTFTAFLHLCNTKFWP